MGMNPSERRYQRWLRVYPKEYRDHRGEEILSTLLDASSGPDGPALRDLAVLVAHGLHVRLALTIERFGRGRLPRSVHGASLCIAFLATLNFLVALGHSGPKNPDSHVANIVVGLALALAVLLLRTWSRILYGVVVGVLATLAATWFVSADLIINILAIIPLGLLMIGWRRYMGATGSDIANQEPINPW